MASSALSAFMPVKAAFQATSEFNDVLGSKDTGLWRTVAGGAQAGVYGLMAVDAAQNMGAQAAKIVDSVKGGHYGDAVVGVIPTAAYGVATSIMTTFAVSSVATAFNLDANLKKASRV